MLDSPSFPGSSQPAPRTQADPHSSTGGPGPAVPADEACAAATVPLELTCPPQETVSTESTQSRHVDAGGNRKSTNEVDSARFDLIRRLETVRADCARGPFEQMRDCLAAIDAALSKGAPGKVRLNDRTVTHAVKVLRHVYVSALGQTLPERRSALSKIRNSCFQLLEEQVLLRGRRFPAKCATEVMDSFAAAGMRCRPLFVALSPRVLRKIDAAPLNEICMVVAAHGRAGIKNPPLFEKAGNRLAPDVKNLEPRAIASLAASFHALGCKHDALFEAIGLDVKKHTHLYSTVDLAMISTACADNKWHDESVALAVFREVSGRISELAPRSIATLWSSFSSFELPSSLLAETLQKAIVRKGHSFSARDVSMTMSALTNMGVPPHSPAWVILMRRTSEIVDYCGMRDISELLSAIVAGGTYDERIARKIAWRASQLLTPPRPGSLALQPEGVLTHTYSTHNSADERKTAQQCSRLREAAALLPALSRTRELVPRLAQEIAKETLRLLPDLSISDVSFILLTLARNRFSSSDLGNAAAEKVLQSPSDVRLVDIGDMAWAFAYSGVDSLPLFEVFKKEALVRLPVLSIPQLANLTMAFAKAGIRDEALFQAVADRLATHDGNFSSYSLSNVSWSYARFDLKHDPLFEKMTSIAPKLIGQFRGGSLSMFMWGVSKLGYSERSMASSIAQRAFEIRDQLNPVHITSLVGAFARTNDRHPLIFDGLAESIVLFKEKFSPRELSSIAWAYATARHRNDRVLVTLADAAKAKLQVRQPATSSEGSSFNPQDISTLIWAMATLGYRDDQLLTELALETTKQKTQFNAQDRAIAGWGFAFFEPNYVSIVCYPALLDSIQIPTQWMQAYQAMIVSGQISGGHEHPRYKQMISQHESAPDSPFEGHVLHELQQTLWGYNVEFETKVMVAGSETDIVVRRRDAPSRFAIVESDGNAFHLVQGPDGGNRVGRDIIQDKLFEKVTGSPAQHILWSEFYGDRRDEHIQRVATGVLRALGVDPNERAASYRSNP